MKPGLVHVAAPSRLHFGLLSLGGPGRQYGGVGVMLSSPVTVIELRSAARFGIDGTAALRVRATVQSWMDFHQVNELPACHISIRELAPQHVGLGSGTQLALSVVSALNEFTGLGTGNTVSLSQAAGRGRRSAVGTYGFRRGGVIVERGRLPHEPLAPLQARIALPETWKFVLVRPRGRSGLFGGPESRAFRDLPPPPGTLRVSLSAELQGNLIPAARAGDFRRFGESLYRYGRLAGLCFAPTQGGPYNGKRLAELVDELRGRGVAGVGQSSWGPTLFALVPDQSHANWLCRSLRRDHPGDELALSISNVSNSGAIIARGNAAPPNPVHDAGLES